MTTEEQVQEPDAFGEVSVSITEEKEFPLDPHLLALSGNNLQQYCTMLSLLEFQNIKPEMFLQTEHGEMALSLATVVEEFELTPWLYEDNESMPFDPLQQGSSGPQVRIHYDFVLHSEGGILQGNPSSCSTIPKPEQGTDRQPSENESVAPREHLRMFSRIQNGHPVEQGLMGCSDAVFLRQEGFGLPNEVSFTAGRENIGTASEQNNTQNISGLDLLLGNGLRTTGCCGDPGVGKVSIHHINHQQERSDSCNGSVKNLNEQLSFVVHEGSGTGEALSSCPFFGNQINHTGEELSQSPSYGHLTSCNTTSPAQHDLVTLPDGFERLFHRLVLSHSPNKKETRLQKRFHCPDCGRGFVHKSSIPRHQKQQHKENLSQNSEQEKSCSPKTQPRKKPPSVPKDGSDVAARNSKRYTALCDVCGQSFLEVRKFHRHLATHSREKPFCCFCCGKRFLLESALVRHLLLHLPKKPFPCSLCDKSYTQRSHLSRHYQINHGVCEQSKEGCAVSISRPPADAVFTV